MTTFEPSLTVPADAVQAAAQIDALGSSLDVPDAGARLMWCVHACAVHRLPLPAWLATAFSNRFRLVASMQARTWDEAFGRAWPKRARLQDRRSHQADRASVYSEARRLIDLAPATAIDHELFDAIGERLGLSGATCERRYREAVADGLPSLAGKRQRVAAIKQR